MNKLDRRDRRRAGKVWTSLQGYGVFTPDAIRMIAAALKREREEAGVARAILAARQKGEKG